MCPVCITTMALVAAGAGSTGGLTAVVVRTLLRGARGKAVAAEPNPELRADSTSARQSHQQGEIK